MTNKTMYTTTREELYTSPLPEETKSYKPIENRRLIETTLESIDKAGFNLKSEIYTAARESQQSNGRYVIGNVGDSEMSLQIGWQNSYNKTLSLKFCLGSYIFICENGAVHGDMGHFKKKHSGEIQNFTPQAISDYISQASDSFVKMQKDRDEMKKIEMNKDVQSTILGYMFFQKELMSITQLGIIKREMDRPTYNYNADDSLWQLYNNVTVSYKNSHPSLWMKQHMDLHNFINNEILENNL